MQLLVLSLLLLAAIMHASWNALLKTSGDPLPRLCLVQLVAMICSVPLVLHAGVPARASWPMLAASVALHQLYYATLVGGYRAGDLSTVYPIARGSAPLLVAAGAWVAIGERPPPLGLAGILLLALGILSLALARSTSPAASTGAARGPQKATLYALACGAVIAAYTIADGLGCRASDDVLAYVAWLFLLQGVPLAIFTVATQRRALLDSWRGGRAVALGGGLLVFSAYALAIWAMSLSPLGYVSALREVSVLLAALIGTRLLGEPFGPRRLASASLVALGILLLQASH